MTYTLPITKPANDKQGLINNVQMIVNALEAGNHQEALYLAVDLVDSLQNCKFQWFDGGANSKPVDLSEVDEPAQRTEIIKTPLPAPTDRIDYWS